MLFIYIDGARLTSAPVDEAMLREAGVAYQAVSLSSEERIRAVRFARDMETGEAESLAIAVNRNIPVLSDDNAIARAVIGTQMHHETSLDLLEAWSIQEHVAGDVLKAAARSMKERANYAPPRRHRLRSWYFALIAEV